MENKFEELRNEIHRLKERFAEDRNSFQAKIEEMESLILGNSFKNSDLQERVKRIESQLKVLAGSKRTTPAPQGPRP